MESLLKLVQWFFRTRFFSISSMYFCYFATISPWKRATPSPLPKDAFCQVLLNWFSGSWEEDFFLLFRNYLPLEKGGSFIWTNISPLNPRMQCSKFGWNWPSWSWEDYISSMYFCNFIIISTWKKGRAIHMNKLDFPLCKDVLCQLWLKLAQWFWRRRQCEMFTTKQRQRCQWRQRLRTTDKFWSRKLTWAFSSGELKMK